MSTTVCLERRRTILFLPTVGVAVASPRSSFENPGHPQARAGQCVEAPSGAAHNVPLSSPSGHSGGQGAEVGSARCIAIPTSLPGPARVRAGEDKTHCARLVLRLRTPAARGRDLGVLTPALFVIVDGGGAGGSAPLGEAAACDLGLTSWFGRSSPCLHSQGRAAREVMCFLVWQIL